LVPGEDDKERGILLLERPPWAPAVVAEEDDEDTGEGQSPDKAIKPDGPTMMEVEPAAPAEAPSSPPAAEALSDFESSAAMQQRSSKFWHFKHAAGFGEYLSRMNNKGIRERGLLVEVAERGGALMEQIDAKRKNEHMHYASGWSQIAPDASSQWQEPEHDKALRKVCSALSELESRSASWTPALADKKEAAAARREFGKRLDDVATAQELAPALLLLSERLKGACDIHALAEWEEAAKAGQTMSQMLVLTALLPKLYHGKDAEETESEEEGESSNSKRKRRSSVSEDPPAKKGKAGKKGGNGGKKAEAKKEEGEVDTIAWRTKGQIPWGETPP